MAFLGPGLSLSGMSTGELIEWDGRHIASSKPAHRGPIFSLYVSNSGIIFSGGKDGLIKIWDVNVSLIQSVDVRTLLATLTDDHGSPLLNPNISPIIRSLCLSENGLRLVVGLQNATIIELIAPSAESFSKKSALNEILTVQMITTGHYIPSNTITATSASDRLGLSALAVHPQKSLCCTGGVDKCLRIWDFANRRLIGSYFMDSSIRSIAVNSQWIVAALSAGELFVYSWLSDNPVSRISKGLSESDPISVAKFSLDSQFLSVGTVSGSILIFEVSESGELYLRRTLTGHCGEVMQIDWSEDSRYLRSNAETFDDVELLFWDVARSTSPASAMSMRGVVWADSTCVLSWETQGVGARYTEWNHLKSLHGNDVCRLLVASDSIGQVMLAKYPFLMPGTEMDVGFGHSRNISSVRFNADSSYVLSIGNEDLCMFQWRLNIPGKVEETDEHTTSMPLDVELELDVDSDTENELAEWNEYMLNKVPTPPVLEQEEDDEKSEEQSLESMEKALREAEEAFFHHRPWKDTIVAPNTLPTAPPAIEDGLSLHFIHGYQCRHTHGNLVLLHQGELCYAMGRIVVIFDYKSQSQRFFERHTSRITAIALHPNGRLVASGQSGPETYILLWDAYSLTQVARFDHQRIGISALAFSPSGNRLVSSGLDPAHTLSLFNSQTYSLLNSQRGGPKPSLSIVWSGISFFSCSLAGPLMWELSEDQDTFVYSPINYHDRGVAQFMLCGATLADGRIVTGSLSGNLYVWLGNDLLYTVDAHGSSITAIYSDDETIVTVGGKEGIVRCWDHEFKCIKTIPVRELMDNAAVGCNPDAPLRKNIDVYGRSMVGNAHNPEPQIRTLCIGEGHFFVGTNDGEIYRIAIQSLKSQCLIQSHVFSCMSPSIPPGILSMACCPMHSARCATSGSDGTLRLWSLHHRFMVAMRPVHQQATALTFMHSSQNHDCVLIAGLCDGSVLFFDLPSLEQLGAAAPSTSAKVTVIQPDPQNNGQVAVGFDDGALVCLSVTSLRPFQLHTSDTVMGTSSIIAMDWAFNAAVLRTNTRGSELHFWSMPSMTSLAHGPSASRDLQWATYTCPMVWETQGLSYTPEDERLLASMDGSTLSPGLAVAGWSSGRIGLVALPCIKPGATHKSYYGHLNAIAAISWSGGQKFLNSVGECENWWVQWRHRIADGIDSESEGEVTCDGKEMVLTSSNPLHHKHDALVDSEAEMDKCLPSTHHAYPEITPHWQDEMVQTATDSPPPVVDKLSLTHVIGFRGHDCHDNLHVLNSGAVVYHTDKIVVVADSCEQSSQRFYQGHTQTVTALCIHPNGIWVLSAQANEIHMWDATTFELQAKFRFAGSGIQCLAMHGPWLACVESHGSHTTLHLLDSTESHKPVASVPCNARKIFAIALNAVPCVEVDDPLKPRTILYIVTCGIKHIQFWNLERNAAIPGVSYTASAKDVLESTSPSPMYRIQPQQPKYTNVSGAKLQTHLVAHIPSQRDNTIVTGTRDGGLYVWQLSTAQLKSIVPITPKSSVHMIMGCNAGLLVGTSDGKLSLWNVTHWQRVWRVGLKGATSGVSVNSRSGLSIRAACTLSDGTFAPDTSLKHVLRMTPAEVETSRAQMDCSKQLVLLVGTRSNQIFRVEVSSEQGKPTFHIFDWLNAHGPASRSHLFLKSNLPPFCATSVVAHPTKPWFVTGGADGTIRCWYWGPNNAAILHQGWQTTSSITSLSLTDGVGFGCPGMLLGVGLAEGSWQLVSIDFESGEVTRIFSSEKRSNHAVTALRILPPSSFNPTSLDDDKIISQQPQLIHVLLGHVTGTLSLSVVCVMRGAQLGSMGSHAIELPLVSVLEHGSALSRLDLDVTGQYARTNDLAGYCYYWRISFTLPNGSDTLQDVPWNAYNSIKWSLQLLPSSTPILTGLSWASYTANYLYEMSGLWQSHTVISTDVSLRQTATAVGSANGDMILAPFPSSQVNTFETCSGHNTPISHVCWIHGSHGDHGTDSIEDIHVISAGDTSLMVWTRRPCT